jgi:uncharacterized protein YcfJ
MSLALLYAYFVLFYDNHGVTYSGYKINKEFLNPGDTFTTIIKRCSNKSYPIKTSVYLVDGSSLLISSREGIIAKGCYSVDGNEKKIPDYIVPGTYQIRTEIVYEVKWLLFSKQNNISLNTQPFRVRGIQLNHGSTIE